jgi:putative transposase
MSSPSPFRHLGRLDRVWIENPCYFITLCTEKRRHLLAADSAASILRQEWRQVGDRYGWAVGSYCIMPDHAHFFCADAAQDTPLSVFVGKWKEGTAKKINRILGLQGALWQKGFFDHLLRSSESYSAKWEYVRNNPVRAKLVSEPDEWPFQGHIHCL